MPQRAYRPQRNRRDRDPNQLAIPPLVCVYRAVLGAGLGPEFMVIYSTGTITFTDLPAWTCGSETLLVLQETEDRVYRLEFSGDISAETEVTFPSFPEISVGPNTQYVATTLVPEPL